MCSVLWSARPSSVGRSTITDGEAKVSSLGRSCRRGIWRSGRSHDHCGDSQHCLLASGESVVRRVQQSLPPSEQLRFRRGCRAVSLGSTAGTRPDRARVPATLVAASVTGERSPSVAGSLNLIGLPAGPVVIVANRCSNAPIHVPASARSGCWRHSLPSSLSGAAAAKPGPRPPKPPANLTKAIDACAPEASNP